MIARGDGPPLVLIPPLPGFKESWLACVEPLSRRFRVVTFDLRLARGDHDGWALALDDLDRVLAAFAPGRVGVMGHSLGGALAQRWTLARPERVKALVLSSSFARLTTPRGDAWARFIEQPLVLASQRLLPKRAALALAARFARRGAWVYDPRCDARTLEFVRACIRDVPVSLALAAVRLAMRHDTRADLARIEVPTLIVVGERESGFARAAANELAGAIRGAELRVSPGVAHLHLFSSAEWLVDQVTAWLAPRLAA